MRSAISALAGFALAGSFAFAQPSDGRLKIIHETATLRVAYRTDSRPFSYLDAQGRPVGYTIELCERIARSLEAQLNMALTIKWVPVDQRTRFDAIVNDTADMECGSTTISLSRMKIVDFSSVVFADSTGVLVKSGKELFTFDNMAGKNIGVVVGTTNARAVRDQLARRNLSATLVEFRDRREGIAALARGDLDGFASDKFVLLALATAESLRDFMLLPDDLSFEPCREEIGHFDSRSTLLSHMCFVAGKSSGSTLNTLQVLAWVFPTGPALCSCSVACRSDCGPTR